MHGVVVDTAFFKGNYPPYISVEATSIEGYPEAEVLETVPWVTLVEKSPCKGDTENYYEVDNPMRWTHVRLNIFPDGGVARFRVHGEGVIDPRFLTTTVDLLAQENGGRLLSASDAFYSTPANLILRHRPGSWARAGRTRAGAGKGTTGRSSSWPRAASRRWSRSTRRTSSATPRARCRISVTDDTPARSTTRTTGGTWCPGPRSLVDTRHRFLVETRRPATHLRLDVYPDGGMTRLRCWGEVPDAVREDLYRRFWEVLPEEHQQYIEAHADPEEAPPTDAS